MTKILFVVGYLALFLASVFNLVNNIVEKQIFGSFIMIPLFVLAIVGIVCGIILNVKNKNTKNKGDKE